MAYTASIHFGTSISARHNRRDRYITDREEHIDPNGTHENIRDENIRKVYNDLFGDAVKQHDAKMNEQGHPERRIKDGSGYYTQLCNDRRKNAAKPAYEMIIQIGDKDNHPEPDEAKQIMLDYIDKFEKDNPNLHVYGIYYHNDEQGGPHMHVDFVPTAHGYKRGMPVRPTLSKALYEEDQEYYKNPKDSKDVKRHESAEIKFNARERDSFRDICKQHGLELKDINHEKQEHLSTPEYKSVKAELDKMERELNKAQKTLDFVDDVEKAAQNVESDNVGTPILNRGTFINNEDMETIKSGLAIAQNLRQSMDDIQAALDNLEGKEAAIAQREENLGRVQIYLNDRETHLNAREADLNNLGQNLSREVENRLRDALIEYMSYLDGGPLADDNGELITGEADKVEYLQHKYPQFYHDAGDDYDAGGGILNEIFGMRWALSEADLTVDRVNTLNMFEKGLKTAPDELYEQFMEMLESLGGQRLVGQIIDELHQWLDLEDVNTIHRGGGRGGR